MKKRAASFVGLFLAISFLLPMFVFADIGPKPSVVINFENMPDEPYYVTLLSEKESTGPYSAALTEKDMKYDENYTDYDIYLKFLEYEDEDGYYFLQYFDECTDTNSYTWGYYPPDKFKVLIYFPTSDTFMVSEDVLEL